MRTRATIAHSIKAWTVFIAWTVSNAWTVANAWTVPNVGTVFNAWTVQMMQDTFVNQLTIN